MVAGAGTRLDVPPHVQLDLLPADTPARRHHCIAHAVTTGAIHPGVGLVQVSATGVVVSEPAGAPGIRGVSHARLGTLLVSQPGLGPMEAWRYILRHEQDFAVSWCPFTRWIIEEGNASLEGSLSAERKVWLDCFNYRGSVVLSSEGVKNCRRERERDGYSNERILIKLNRFVLSKRGIWNDLNIQGQICNRI